MTQYTHTQKRAPKLSVPLGDGEGGAIQSLKEVGKDGENLGKAQSPRPGTQQNHWFLWSEFTWSKQNPLQVESQSSFLCGEGSHFLQAALPDNLYSLDAGIL